MSFLWSESAAEVPEGFGIDAVELSIRGFAHTTGEPVVIVLAPLRRGHSVCHHVSLSVDKEESAE